MKKSQTLYITKIFYIFLIMMPVVFFILLIKFKVGSLNYNLNKYIKKSSELFIVEENFFYETKEGVFYICKKGIFDNRCYYKVKIDQ